MKFHPCFLETKLKKKKNYYEGRGGKEGEREIKGELPFTSSTSSTYFDNSKSRKCADTRATGDQGYYRETCRSINLILRSTVLIFLSLYPTLLSWSKLSEFCR